MASLKEYGDAPVRTVSCAGAQGSGKTTLMRSMFGAEAGSLEDGLALLEVDSDCAYLPETNEFQVGTGQAMVSLAVSDVMIYNVLVHDLRRPDALLELQVRTSLLSRVCRLSRPGLEDCVLSVDGDAAKPSYSLVILTMPIERLFSELCARSVLRFRSYFLWSLPSLSSRGDILERTCPTWSPSQPPGFFDVTSMFNIEVVEQ